MSRTVIRLLCGGVMITPLVAYGVLYTWDPDVENGKWREDHWLFTCPVGQTCADYPDDDNDDALIVIGQNDDYPRTIEIHNDCIDEFTHDGYDGASAGLLTLNFISDGSGPKKVTCSSVTIDGFGTTSDQTTQFIVSDGAELTTIGTCE